MWSLIGLPAGARNSAGSKRLFLMVRRSATSCAEALEASIRKLASDREVRREAQGKRGREREGRLALERLEARAHPLGLVECVEGEEQPVRHELGVGAELEFGLEPLQPFARRVVDSGIGRLDRE